MKLNHENHNMKGLRTTFRGDFIKTETWRIFRIMSEFVDGQFELQWTTDFGSYDRFTIGDCNNDGIDELIISKSASGIIMNL